MTRKLKFLGVALVAVLAMGVVLASNASAAKDTFTAEAGLAKVSATQEGHAKFTVAGQAVECEKATGSASITATDLDEMSGLTAEYSGCNYGPNPLTVHMNGCTYTVKGTTDENAKGEKHGTVSIDCPAGKHAEFTIPAINCIITVKQAGAANGSQVGVNGGSVTTIGSGTTRELTGHMTMTTKVSNDTLDKTKPDTLACTNIVGNAVLTGTGIATGESATGAHVGIFDDLI